MIVTKEMAQKFQIRKHCYLVQPSAITIFEPADRGGRSLPFVLTFKPKGLQ